VSLFSLPQVYYAPDVGGLPGGGESSAPKGVTPSSKSIEAQLAELSETNKRIFKLLRKSLGMGEADAESDESSDKKDSASFQEIFKEAVTDPLKDIFTFDDLFGGLFGEGEDNLLGGLFGDDKSKEKPKKQPKINDMLKLPAEHATGFTLLYWKLDEIAGLLDGSKDEKEKEGKGVGGFFQGLLKGATSLVLLAGAMFVFAGALMLFAQLGPDDWKSALLGIGMFALFVTGAIVVAKLVSKFQSDFQGFAKGVIYLTGAMILFGGAIFVMAWVKPYVPDAIDGMKLFGVFVLGAVLVSRLVSENTESFAKFATGILILTGALVLFAGAIFVMDWVQPYIPGALTGIGLFLAFTGAVALLSRIVGSQIGAFTQFIVGTLLMSLSLALFGGVVLLVSHTVTLEDVGRAAGVLAAMLGFVALVGAIGYAMGPLLPGIGVILIGAVALTASMMAFALGIAVVRNIGAEDVATASEVTLGMNALMLKVGMLGYAAGLAIPGLALFATASVLLSAGMMAFSAAIHSVAQVADDVPIAIPALRDMMKFLTNPDAIQGSGEDMSLVQGEDPGVLELLEFVGVGVLAKLGVFGMALTPFANGMRRFAETIRVVAEVGEVVPAGIAGLQKMMKFLTNPAGRINDAGEPIDPAEQPGALQLMDAVSGAALLKLGAFGLALRPFSSSMKDFAEVIRAIAEIGSPERIDMAITGIGNMMGLLVGGGPADVERESSVVGMMDAMRLRVAIKLAAFGAAIGPLSSALLDFTEVVQRVIALDGQVKDAIPGLKSMFNFLAGPQPWSVSSMISDLEYGLAQNVGAFGQAIQPFAEGMLQFTEVIEQVIDLEGDKIDTAILGLRQMVEFLSEAGETVEGVVEGTGFMGWGSSALEDFGEAIQPFSEGIGVFLSLTERMAGNEENIDSSENVLDGMVNMLTAAGAVIDRGGSPQRMGQFSQSLDLLGEGINRFTGEVEGNTPFVLDRIADALERIAEIEFGQMFTPFIQFMEHNEKLTETAEQLERINQAIAPQETTTLDRISGAIGSIFNGEGGGDRAELSNSEAAAYVRGGNPDGSLQGYVAGMYDILSRWDREPIALPSGEGGTNVMIARRGSGGEGNSFGGNF